MKKKGCGLELREEVMVEGEEVVGEVVGEEDGVLVVGILEGGGIFRGVGSTMLTRVPSAEWSHRPIRTSSSQSQIPLLSLEVNSLALFQTLREARRGAPEGWVKEKVVTLLPPLRLRLRRSASEEWFNRSMTISSPCAIELKESGVRKKTFSR